MRGFRDFGIAQPPQDAVLLAHDRPEALEPGAAERGVVRKQEIAPPKALARDGAVGLRIDGEEDARRAVRLRHAPRDHQHVAVGIGVGDARAQIFRRERHRIVIGVIVICPRSPGAGMNAVGDGPAHILAERGRQAQ